MSENQGKPTAAESELEQLRAELEEARETLAAIRDGAVDALVIDTPEGQRIFTLEGAEQTYRVLVEQMQEGAVTLDAGGTIHYCNARFADMLRLPLEKVMGRHIQGWLTSADRPALMAMLEEGRGRKELVLTAPDGAETLVLVSAIRIERVVCLVLTDLSERKHHEASILQLNAELKDRTAEAEARADQLRRLSGELVASEERERRKLTQVLHDHLQQLLVAAKMRVSAVRTQPSDERLRGLLHEVDDLLGQSIGESRSLTAELSPPVLYEAGLAAGLEWLGRWMKEKHGFAVHVAVVEPFCDIPQKLQIFFFQAIREMLFNAVKHAGVRSACVGLQMEDGHVVVTVEDRGSGFDPAAANHGREGFGLFSVRERLELLGGRMDLQSAPGQGTRVTMRVPVELTVAMPKIGTQPAATAGIASDRRAGGRASSVLRVLVADDHKIVREGLSGILREQADIEVVGGAENGQVALDLAHQLRPDVVVMDVTMPVLNGVEATRRITQELPEIRVIALSMHPEADMAEAMRQAGAWAYLRKDGPAEDLVAAIRRCATGIV